MAYSVQFTPEATAQVRALRANDGVKIVDQCRHILSVNPKLESRSRVKRLAGGVFPPYRLRVGDYRVFYDVSDDSRTVMIYGVLSKSQASRWLASRQKESGDEGEEHR